MAAGWETGILTFLPFPSQFVFNSFWYIAQFFTYEVCGIISVAFLVGII
jgi:hypothetical protein